MIHDAEFLSRVAVGARSRVAAAAAPSKFAARTRRHESWRLARPRQPCQPLVASGASTSTSRSMTPSRVTSEP
jgi:hypothetical protein